MAEAKRKKSILIPYYKTDSGLQVFLQKRSAKIETLPNYFGLCGGAAEGDETPEEALVREIREEIGIDLELDKVTFFNHYEFLNSIKDVYSLEVEPGWEDHLIINKDESDYGQWFSTEEALQKTDFIHEDKVVINDLERALLQKPIA